MTITNLRSNGNEKVNLDVLSFYALKEIAGESRLEFDDKITKMDLLRLINTDNRLTRNAPKKIITNKIIPEQEEAWPDPHMFSVVETPEIPASVLPDLLAGYCKAVTDNTQTPSGMAVMMGLSIIATCLQKRFEVSPYDDSSYTEPVNLMTVTALDPASRKSAVVRAMTEPLIAWEMKQAESLKEQAVMVHHERDILTKSIESRKFNASKTNLTDGDRLSTLTEIKRLEDNLPQEIIIPKLWVDDVTPERLQNLMVENGERMAVISAEGGIFEVISGLYSGGKSNINVILQSHAGDSVRVERQGRSVTMLKPALTFGLTVQPSIITDLAAGNKARFRGNGMLARFLFCIPKSTIGCRDVTMRLPVQEQIRDEYHSLIYRLLSIQPITDEFGKECPRMLTLGPDALKVWLTFYQYIESKQGEYGEYYSIQDWTGKLPGAVLRIAGLCHVVENGETCSVISVVTLERAIDLGNRLIVHAKAAFAMMGTDLAVPDAKIILKWIIRNGADSFRRGDLHKALHGRFLRVDRLISALKVLTERNIIDHLETRPTGHRPELIYRVNPMVLNNDYHVRT